MFSNVYAGRRVLVTGHTGFKGSWLCTWLLELGAEVAGYSLEEAVDFTSRWYHRFYRQSRAGVFELAVEQIAEYCRRAAARCHAWMRA